MEVSIGRRQAGRQPPLLRLTRCIPMLLIFQAVTPIHIEYQRHVKMEVLYIKMLT